MLYITKSYKSINMQSPCLIYPRRTHAVRQVIQVLGILAVAGGIAFGLLLLLTRSVSNAAAVALIQAKRRGITYPGLPPPPHFIDSLVATEDQRFYSVIDPGVDPFAIARAILAEITPHRADPGGSTIPQQLAKMLFTPRRNGLVAKMEQVILAIKLSFTYPRASILSMYAEVAYYGDGYYSLTAASCGYFGREPADLSWAQAATLAGVVNEPTADDPRKHPEKAHLREAHVLDRLVAVGDLTRAQAAAVSVAAARRCEPAQTREMLSISRRRERGTARSPESVSLARSCKRLRCTHAPTLLSNSKHSMRLQHRSCGRDASVRATSSSPR